MKEPRQARSRETLERLENAAVRLLKSRTWNDLTIADLVSEADSSVGSFYGRFADKDALLDHLDELYTERTLALLSSIIASPAPDLRAAVNNLLRSLVAYHESRRGLIRALVLRARILREPLWNDRTRRMNSGLPEVLEWLSRHRSEIRRRDPDRALFLGFSFIFSALRDRILFPESIVDPQSPAGDQLADELSRMLLAYLTDIDE
jgi:AcrR family transcriptional regulator